MSRFVYVLLAATLRCLLAYSLQQPLTNDVWSPLRSTFRERLIKGVPFVSSCVHGKDSICEKIQASYRDEVFRTTHPGAYVNPQWETCQLTGEQCLLDYTNTSDISPISPPHRCHSGSVPEYFIDVESAEDVVAGFEFSRRTGIPLVVKNTGHDYKGRSSGAGSLALWMHNLKDMSYHPDFTADGCKISIDMPTVTVGAGVQWHELYDFAESHNVTAVGGTDRSVGVSGGWLQGGGHSLLTNTMGLGVDRVVQFKVVTPDGQLRTANSCQNTDLFFALRGGGGGTFGVVMESTHIVSPQITLQVVIVGWAQPDPALTQEMWSIMVDNAPGWSNDGWGAVSRSQISIHVNPKLNHEGASHSMTPLINFGRKLQNLNVSGAQLVVAEYSSWGAFFDDFSSKYVASVGVSLALASRLVSKSNFETPSSKSAVVSALMKANEATPGLLIMMTTPASYTGDGQTSVTDAWRSSLYHVTVVSPWNWDASVGQKREHYSRVSNSIDHLRRITPDAAYLNEADVYEANHEVSFWGNHYQSLLQIKEKYDPDHLLDCWQCVGWDSNSPRFSCYL